MDNFYKSKLGEYEKRILELKEIYEKSLERHKLDEKKAQDRAKSVSFELSQIIEELNEAKRILKATKDENDRLLNDNIKLKEERIDFNKRVEDFNKNVELKNDDIKKAEIKMMGSMKDANNALAIREEEAKKFKADALNAQIKNKVICDDINKKISELEIKEKEIADSKLVLKEQQFKFQEEVKNNNSAEIKAQAQENNIFKKTLDDLSLKLNNRQDFLDNKDKILIDKEKMLDDKEIDINYREIELIKLEDKVRKLIEINKVKI